MPLSRAALLLVLVSLLPDRRLASGSEVRVEGGRVIVQATGTPLTEVLSRFSEATGAKVLYDRGAKPRQLVTVEIDAASAAEAVSQLLEGQGLGYALRLDPSGQGVEILFLMGKGQAPSTPSSTTAAEERREAFDPPGIESYPTDDEPNPVELLPGEAGETTVEPAVLGAPPPGSGPPQKGAPFPFSSPWQPAAPSFPQVASYPAWR